MKIDAVVELPEKLEGAGREILLKLFPSDMSMSREVHGTILTAPGKAVFEMKGLFLYRDSYSAVTHLVVFRMKENGGYSIVSVDGREFENSVAPQK